MNPPAAPLAQVRILSLALNLPGPAALMRCRQMGASCTKLEPPSGDPMQRYSPTAYQEMHEGVKVLRADLKTEVGQQQLHRQLQQTDVLLTSFRPSALAKLGLGWPALHGAHPHLCQVAIVGAPGARAEEPGHDLTYLAENGLVPDLSLPPTLYADMAGSLAATQAVLQAALLQAERYAGSGEAHPVGRYFEVALSDAAAYLALPRHWGLTTPSGTVGGAHAGYQVYPCQDGRVAVAALEPHFAAALCRSAGIEPADPAAASTRQALVAFFASRSRAQLDELARTQDLPLHTLGPTPAA
jgi:crotonobetainyl-CoA:carnitine CoA-transferase CaiB-like acyl-CoA transferase